MSVGRKARSGCFGPFVCYEHFPGTDCAKKEEKEQDLKKKDKEEIKKRTTEGRKKSKLQRRKNTT
jgi:hypothetical protein